MDISVIIVNYKSEKYLEACFSSLNKLFQNYSWEIILVNNENKSLPSSLKNSFSNLEIFNNEKNAGFAQACNFGARLAKGGILFFLNPDTEAVGSISSNFLSDFENPTVGIIAPSLHLPSGEIQPWSAGRKLDFFSLLTNNLKGRDDFNYSLLEADWVSGAAFFLRKDIFERIGGFDEKFFMYFEDLDLCLRIKKNGYRILRFSEFSILHFGGQSYLSSNDQKGDYYRSQDYYFRKNFGFIAFILVKFLRQCFLLTRSLKNLS